MRVLHDGLTLSPIRKDASIAVSLLWFVAMLASKEVSLSLPKMKRTIVYNREEEGKDS